MCYFVEFVSTDDLHGYLYVLYDIYDAVILYSILLVRYKNLLLLSICITVQLGLGWVRLG